LVPPYEVRFDAHSGLRLDITPLPRSADFVAKVVGDICER